MQLPNYKKIEVENINPGDVYCGYETLNEDDTLSVKICSILIDKDRNPLVYGKEIENKENIKYYYRTYTKEESIEWFNEACDLKHDRNQLNLMGIHHDLYDVGDASHQYWNAWIMSNWKNQLIGISDKDYFIVGVAPAPYPAKYIPNSIAVVAEYDATGERFWSHASEKTIESLRSESLEAYNSLMNK